MTVSELLRRAESITSLAQERTWKEVAWAWGVIDCASDTKQSRYRLAENVECYEKGWQDMSSARLSEQLKRE